MSRGKRGRRRRRDRPWKRISSKETTLTPTDLERLTLDELRPLCVAANLRDLHAGGRGYLHHDAAALLGECRRRGLVRLWGECRSEAGEQFAREAELEMVRRRTT